MVEQRLLKGTLLAATLLLSSCATLDQLMEPPNVSLRYVQAKAVDFRRQTFELGFDVTNPNPVSLPVDSFSYAIKLDGQRFASGESTGSFAIPAGGDTTFSMSVELDLLKTAPQLLTVVSSAMHREIPYELEGTFGIGSPLIRPLKFTAAGSIELGPEGLQAAE